MKLSRFLSHAALFVSICCVLILYTTACGVKGDPVAPKKIVIPPIADLSGWLKDGSVILRWTPSLKYADGAQIELRSVEIYRLNEELGERLMQQEEREAEQKRAVAEAGMQVRDDSSEQAGGLLNTRIIRLQSIPPSDFTGRSQLVATLPVEQLVDQAVGGRIVWRDRLALPPAPLPGNRSVYAVRSIDVYGRRSDLSNFTFIYPLQTPPPARSLTAALTQDKLTLLWEPPDRSVQKFLEFALIGYNLYRNDAEAPVPDVPVNAAPLPTPAPLDWVPVSIISHQRLTLDQGSYAYLFTCDNSANAAGIWQTIFPADGIAARIGTEVEVSVVMRSIGDACSGRIVLDASVNPLSPQTVSGADLFKEEENPLIQIEPIQLTSQFDTYTFKGKVPLGAVAYRLRIEPRGRTPVRASFVISSVSIKETGGTVNLAKNGDFTSFGALQYAEDVKNFGSSVDYRIAAVYRIADNIVESASTEPAHVSFEDTFPPDSPAGVRAQATFDAISITWNPSRAKDLRGYLVYRQEPGDVRWRKITEEPIAQTIYRDADVKAKIVYTYKVEAIDRRGNQSDDAQPVTSQLLERGK